MEDAVKVMKHAKPCQSRCGSAVLLAPSTSLGPFLRLVSGFARVRDGASYRRAVRVFVRLARVFPDSRSAIHQIVCDVPPLQERDAIIHARILHSGLRR
jgi:hypothetical protein